MYTSSPVRVRRVEKPVTVTHQPSQHPVSDIHLYLQMYSRSLALNTAIMHPTTPPAYKASTSIWIRVGASGVHALVLLLIRLQLDVSKRLSEIQPDILTSLKSVPDRACSDIEIDLQVDISTHTGPYLVARLHHSEIRGTPVVGGFAKLLKEELKIRFKILPLLLCWEFSRTLGLATG